MPWRLSSKTDGAKNQMWGRTPSGPTPRTLFRRRLWRQNHFAAGLLDRGDGRGRGGGDVDRQLGRDLALAEQPDRRLGATHQAGSLELGARDRAGGVQPLGVDRGLDAAEI